MSFKKYCTPGNILFIGMLILMIGFFVAYKIYALRLAHGSFDNYYKFRGCVHLVEKTDTYGICELSSGETIKLVNIGNKWYLDGDGQGVF